MDEIAEQLIKKQNASDHLANERTMLAWIRTCIGIMAFGFVVVKFSLFIKQIGVALGKTAAIHQYSFSAPLGIVLVAFGGIGLLLSLLRYNRTRQMLDSGTYKHSPGLLFAITGIVLVISIILIVYLVLSTE